MNAPFVLGYWVCSEALALQKCLDVNLVCFAYNWNDGRLEIWNDEFKGFLSLLKKTCSAFIPNIPFFHHSIIPYRSAKK
jgi:hypothetical protein